MSEESNSVWPRRRIDMSDEAREARKQIRMAKRREYGKRYNRQYREWAELNADLVGKYADQIATLTVANENLKNQLIIARDRISDLERQYDIMDCVIRENPQTQPEQETQQLRRSRRLNTQ